MNIFYISTNSKGLLPSEFVDLHFVNKLNLKDDERLCIHLLLLETSFIVVN
jgi:hypothetical protein